MIKIRLDDLSGAPTRALLALHLAGMHAHSPPDAVHALDLAALSEPGMTVWTAWIEGAVAGIGALRMLDDGVAEIKSMRTHPDHLRRGVAAALLAHMLAEGGRQGVRCFSLETGSGDAFGPALAFYRRQGFVTGAPFGDYVKSPFNQCLHLRL